MNKGKVGAAFEYSHTYTQFLAFLKIGFKIALGTSVIDMLFYNLVILAKRFATLGVLSEGRAIANMANNKK